MSIVFDLDHKTLASDPRFVRLARILSTQPRIDSTASFNHYCTMACRVWAEQFRQEIRQEIRQETGELSAKYTELLGRIAQGGDEVIPTPWGGVVITLHEPPRIEKYLVIRQGKYLALEKHDEKDEHIEVQEGAGLLLYRRTAGEPLTVQALTPGDQFHFEPGREHCLIGTENLLVFERSTDPKGMDQDLIFLYEPEGSL